MKYTFRTLWFMIKAYLMYRKVLRKSKRLPDQERWEAGYRFVKEYCPKLMERTGSRIIYHGLEKLPEHSGVLYVGNHQSLFDIVVILSVMEYPTAFLNKKELEKVPLIGGLARLLGCVYIDRKDLRQSVSAIRTTSERMKNGLNMVIFPEGTRSKDGTIAEFKKGSLRAATNIGAEVVPIRISRSIRDILENNKGLHIIPQEVHVYFGDPIDVTEMDKKEQKEIAEKVQKIVSELE